VFLSLTGRGLSPPASRAAPATRKSELGGLSDQCVNRCDEGRPVESKLQIAEDNERLTGGSRQEPDGERRRGLQ
jgi:hypothetical protein